MFCRCLLVPQLVPGWKCPFPGAARDALFCRSSEVRRNPTPSMAVKVLICIPWEKPNVFGFGMDLIPGGSKLNWRGYNEQLQ